MKTAAVKTPADHGVAVFIYIVSLISEWVGVGSPEGKRSVVGKSLSAAHEP